MRESKKDNNKTQEKDDAIRVQENEKCTIISEQHKLINVWGNKENEGENKEEEKGSWGLGLVAAGLITGLWGASLPADFQHTPQTWTQTHRKTHRDVEGPLG